MEKNKRVILNADMGDIYDPTNDFKEEVKKYNIGSYIYDLGHQIYCSISV